MKICGRCKVKKQLSEFNKNKAKSDGLAGICRECSRGALKQHYLDNRAKAIAERAAYKEQKRKECRDYIKSLNSQCSRCPENHPACMDFHHVDASQKEREISILVASGSLRLLKKELAKCIPLCSNCHRKLHYDERVPAVGIEPTIPEGAVLQTA